MKPPGRPTARPIYTVSELTREIKSLLEQAFPFVWLSGEISNLRTPASGHHYFTIKDQTAQIGAVIFKGPAARLKFALTNGLAVVGLGRLSVYEPRGTYQVIFEHLEPKGRGALQLAFEQLKAKLAEEGLFDPGHKKKPPLRPRKIHVITSPTGAVVRDIIHVVQRRFPNMPLAVIPTRVQGANAEHDILRALTLLNQLPDAELAILARGGGSLEDLQAFNSEAVARALFASRVPVISAVGHETDMTIADFAADLRAPTPSAAAEIAVPEKDRLQRQCVDLTSRLMRRMTGELLDGRKALERLVRRLRDPRRRIQDFRIRLDEDQGRLLRILGHQIETKKVRLRHAHVRLSRIPIRGRIDIYHHKLEQINYKLLNIISNKVKEQKNEISNLTRRLETLSPLSVLQRGYSITRALPSRQVVKSADTIRVEQQVEVQLASGTLLCRVEGKPHHGEEKF